MAFKVWNLRRNGDSVFYDERKSVCVNAIGCGLETNSRKLNIYLNVYFHYFALVSGQSAALSSATQHAMPSEFGGKWATECLNIRFTKMNASKV